jgi:hypothetical protein
MPALRPMIRCRRIQACHFRKSSSSSSSKSDARSAGHAEAKKADHLQSMIALPRCRKFMSWWGCQNCKRMNRSFSRRGERGQGRCDHHRGWIRGISSPAHGRPSQSHAGNQRPDESGATTPCA